MFKLRKLCHNLKSLILAIIPIIILCSCSIDKNDITKYADMGNENKLIKFIDKNKNNQEKYDLILYAINEIITKDLENCKKFIENSYIISIAGNELEYNVFKVYNNNKITFSDWNNLLLKYFETNNIILNDQLLIMLNNYDDGNLKQFYEYSIEKILKEIQNANFIELKNKLPELTTKLNKLSLIRINEDQKNKIQQLDISISKFNDSFLDITTIEENLIKTKTEIDTLKNRLTEDEKYIEDSGDYFYLSAYIVAQTSYTEFSSILNEYEIALENYDYFGSIPSQNHAILLTIETQFSSKGRFALYAKKLYEIPIQIKQEFGGFTQNWSVYMEISDQTISTIKNKKNDINKFKALLKKKSKKKKKLNEDLVKKKTKIEGLKSEIISQLIND
jgi:hypothetical protein